MKPLLILHAADLHLGGAVAAPDEAMAPLAARARQECLDRMVELSRARGVKLVLLAGDVFQTPRPPLSARLALEKAVHAWLGMGAQVFIAPGNHDPFSDDSVWAAWPATEGLHIFGVRPEGVALAEHGLWIAGVAHAHDQVSEDLSRSLPPPPAGLSGLALLHCALGAAGGAREHQPYAPAELPALLASPFGYWALGHVHRPQQVAANPLVLYAGSPQGAHLAEPGGRGVYLVELNGSSATAEFHPIAPLVFQDLSLDDLQAVHTASELVGRVRGALDPPAGGETFRRCLRLNLAGPSPLCGELWDEGRAALAEALKAELGLAGLVLGLEGLHPALDQAALAGRDDVLGRMLQLIDQAERDPAFLAELAESLRTRLHPLSRHRKAEPRQEHVAELLEAVRSLALRDLAREDGQ